jgi:hypothetical protein
MMAYPLAFLDKITSFTAVATAVGMPQDQLDALQRAQQSQLPAELVLLILPLVPLETRRSMTTVCKQWHFLLLADVAKEILRKRLAPTAPKKSRFASLKDVEEFS